MCVTSMIMDHYRDRWYPLTPVPMPQPVPFSPGTGWQPMPTIQIAPAISAEEVAEFRRLLDRAREYDKRHNEPDCELDEKREMLKKMAAALGVDISFVDEPPSVDAVGQRSDNPI
jgi:hypothetical protein